VAREAIYSCSNQFNKICARNTEKYEEIYAKQKRIMPDNIKSTISPQDYFKEKKFIARTGS